MTTHIPTHCSVKSCSEEARHWIADIAGLDTFYVCDDHNVGTEVDLYAHIEADGHITVRDVASYACSETCATCNA